MLYAKDLKGGADRLSPVQLFKAFEKESNECKDGQGWSLHHTHDLRRQSSGYLRASRQGLDYAYPTSNGRTALRSRTACRSYRHRQGSLEFEPCKNDFDRYFKNMIATQVFGARQKGKKLRKNDWLTRVGAAFQCCRADIWIVVGSHVPRDVLGRGKDRNIAADSVNITSGGIYFKHSKGGQEKAFNCVKGVDMLNNTIVRSRCVCVCVCEREMGGGGGKNGARVSRQSLPQSWCQ